MELVLTYFFLDISEIFPRLRKELTISLFFTFVNKSRRVHVFEFKPHQGESKSEYLLADLTFINYLT